MDWKQETVTIGRRALLSSNALDDKEISVVDQQKLDAHTDLRATAGRIRELLLEAKRTREGAPVTDPSYGVLPADLLFWVESGEVLEPQEAPAPGDAVIAFRVHDTEQLAIEQELAQRTHWRERLA